MGEHSVSPLSYLISPNIVVVHLLVSLDNDAMGPIYNGSIVTGIHTKFAVRNLEFLIHIVFC